MKNSNQHPKRINGNKLKMYRIKAGYTLTEAGEHISVNRNTLGRMEKTGKVVKIQTLQNLAYLYGVNTEDFYDDIESEIEIIQTDKKSETKLEQPKPVLMDEKSKEEKEIIDTYHSLSPQRKELFKTLLKELANK